MSISENKGSNRILEGLQTQPDIISHHTKIGKRQRWETRGGGGRGTCITASSQTSNPNVLGRKNLVNLHILQVACF